MGDLSDYFKNLIMSKSKGENFGTTDSLKGRVEKMKTRRKDTRQGLLTTRRRIPETMTPDNTPGKAPEESQIELNVPNKRLEMLNKWKKEKDKRKEVEKQKAKPLFKVSHVPVGIGLINLENVNREIKGKPIKSKFAPTGHKFKAPANVKPINLAEDKKKVVQEQLPRKMVTRSESRKQLPSVNLPGTSKANAVKAKAPTKKQVKPKSAVGGAKKQNKTSAASTSNKEHIRFKKDCSNESTLMSPDFPIMCPSASSSSDATSPDLKSLTRKTGTATPRSKSAVSSAKKQNKTSPASKTINKDQIRLKSTITSPDFSTACSSAYSSPGPSSANLKSPNRKTGEETPMYMSPFVTVSRGKGSARKERLSRKSKDANSLLNTPSAGAAYFTCLLDNQISRFQELCEEWKTYKNADNVPEEASSMIDVALGQTTLLITKKCEQFRGLIENCKNPDCAPPVTCEDLHGFWDMINIQITNLDKRFENLNNLRENNWQEILPKPKKTPVKKNTKKTSKKAKASSALKAAIAARRRNLLGSKTGSDEGNEETVKKSPGKSLLDSVKSFSENKRRVSSPGLTMMRVSQYAKGVETPSRSILKTNVPRSAKSFSKTVLFHDKVEVADIENDLNQSNSSGLECDTKQSPKSPRRRSTRLAERSCFN